MRSGITLNKSGIERQTVQELAHGIETPLSHLGVENRSSPPDHVAAVGGGEPGSDNAGRFLRNDAAGTVRGSCKMLNRRGGAQKTRWTKPQLGCWVMEIESGGE
jgi:hypothetical protein